MGLLGDSLSWAWFAMLVCVASSNPNSQAIFITTYTISLFGLRFTVADWADGRLKFVPWHLSFPNKTFQIDYFCVKLGSDFQVDLQNL